MSSRRHEDSRMKSSSYVTSSRDRRNDMDHEQYVASSRNRRNDMDHEAYVTTSRRGVRDEQQMEHLRSRRSFSPQHVVAGTRRDRRSDSIERRREYDVVGRVRSDHVLTGLPPLERLHKRPYVDERSVRSTYEYPEYIDHDKTSARSKNHPYGYDECFEVGEEYYIERRSGAGGGHGSVQVGDAVDQKVRLRPNYGLTSRYGEGSGSYSTVDVHRFKDENSRYQDAVPHEKITKEVYYRDEKLPKDTYYTNEQRVAYHSRGIPYLESQQQLPIKDFESEDLVKSVPGTSASITGRGEYAGKVRDVRTLPSDGYPKTYERGIEPVVRDDYEQRIVLEARRGYRPGVMKAECYECDAYASARCEHKDYHPEVGLRTSDDPRYSHHGGLYEKVRYVRGEHDRRSSLGHDVVEAAVASKSKGEDSPFSRRIIRNGGARDLQKEMAQEYVGMRRSSDALKQDRDYLDYGYTHVELTENVPNRRHASEFGGLHEREPQDPYIGYGYEKYAPARSDSTTYKTSPELETNLEVQRFVGGSERSNAEERVVYDRALKRKYSMDEDIIRDDSRNQISGKWNMPTRTSDFDSHWVEWTSRKSSGMHTNKSSRYEQTHYYKDSDQQLLDETYHHKGSTSAYRISYEDQSENIQEVSGKQFQVGAKLFKDYTKPQSSKSYGHTHHSHQRSSHYKQQNLHQRSEDNNHMEVHSQDTDLSDDTGGLRNSELSEETDGFKQKVQAAFLDFSKRFNDNPVVRKLYKEQGKAGSVFCVVCRRSASKDFQDTRALATHAFMSHKVGLRPQHLGLHKALCVLMGWGATADRDSGTWVPETLSRAEALVQKEDLILWPPVVIVHNISLSSNDHNEWKLINIEALGDFLRGKGFSLSKMKICLGNPGDQSVILVKFLSTFSGLQEAERLHKYFLERKYGRVDFETAVTSIEKTVNLRKGSDQADKVEDLLLYGYMGISEDLDKVDFDTKKKCLVKSKKEIHDLADAPVKPE